MALHLDPSEHEPVRREVEKIRAADVGERRVTRDGIEQLAHGALVCPDCALPVVVAEAIPASTRLRCGFCDRVGPAREFLLRDVYDTLANEVYLVARLRG